MVDVQMGLREAAGSRAPDHHDRDGLEYDEADKLLRRAHWNVKAAIVMQKTGLPYARAHWRACGGRTTSSATRSARTSSRVANARRAVDSTSRIAGDGHARSHERIDRL